jgi:hypothetical protein
VSAIFPPKTIHSVKNVPHLPSSGKRVDRDVLPVGVEAELEESGADLGLVNDDPRLIDHELADGDAALVALDIVLDVGRLEILGEIVDLLAVDGLEESRFSASVGSAHAVTVAATELESRVVEEKETSLGEGER